jgi:hypothetical protein
MEKEFFSFWILILVYQWINLKANLHVSDQINEALF